VDAFGGSVKNARHSTREALCPKSLFYILMLLLEKKIMERFICGTARDNIPERRRL
jgi:hypothetical protein